MLIPLKQQNRVEGNANKNRQTKVYTLIALAHSPCVKPYVFLDKEIK
jgi:hypothetical protein